ncbi:MAG: CaiB/BaiF CoA-transferase family protein [Pseudomonadota bacterium]
MGALDGLKVVEMAAIGPVPLAGMMLADMGADVVILDKEFDMWAMPKDIMRRGKRRVELNLKSEEGLKAATDIINSADILIEGFRPGVMEKLGLGPDAFKESNAGLIYGRMTGWGQEGPLSQAAGHDINYIAVTGALHAMGRGESNPTPPLNLVGDYGGGSLFLMSGILAALYERSQSGQGQVIDAAITDGVANLMSIFYNMHKLQMWSPRRASNLLDGASYYYDTYRTSDDKYISIGSLEPQFYALLREKLGLKDEEFEQQIDPRTWPALKAKVADIIATKTRDEWCELMEGTDVCFAPVLDYMEATEYSHNQERGTYFKNELGTQPSPAPRFSRSASQAGGEVEAASIDEVVQSWS